MKPLAVVQTDGTRCKLTVRPDSVTIKLAAGLTPAEIDRCKTFFLRVADQLADTTRTMRGRWKVNEYVGRIQMFNASQSESKLFSEVQIQK